ncbi:monocarboxylate transporter 4 [Copidosoma floridanum]|uniref:monocarboxylate transporter 4 n=1 Tax=Copidosoma floridanum TaxID=29053 RepID=UPI0006C9C0D5|nr:monocarboxylate transporter 4 [Copidosoma floridanum]XP_014205912.1 monocarboxylate transporter 4 [Copidosoma floridanum]XP_014205913.1 monocarboxylate transporter 4 [Copidosoma floridanum]
MAIAETTSKDEDCGTPLKQQQNGQSVKEHIALNDTNDTAEEDFVEVEVSVPPDGGWGWVVVAASFMCNLVVDGIMFSFGVFLKEMSQDLQVSPSKVALAGSLQTGFYLLAGPFVSALANKFGFRLVAILGSVIASLAFVLSYFVTSIEVMCLTYGVLGGIGAGLIYVPAVIAAGYYFEKLRGLATGISVCGSGIGAFVLSPIAVILIEKYGWRKAMLCQGGLLLNCAIFGMTFKPVKPTRVKIPKDADIHVQTTATTTATTTAGRLLGTNNNADYPTAGEAIRDSNPNIINGTSKSLHSLHRIQEVYVIERQVSTSEKQLSVPIYPELRLTTDEELKLEEENNLLDGDAERLNGKVPTIRRHTMSTRRSRADSVTSHKSFKQLDKRRGSRDTQRPFYRDDIFYGGSLNRLPHYRSQPSSVGYHMSVTRLPTAQDLAEEEEGRSFNFCPESVKRILTTMLDISLLKKPSFVILSISGCLTMMGFYTPFVFVKDRALESGVDSNSAMFLVSIIGIGNVIGRLVFGGVVSLPGINALVVNNVFITLSGLLTMFSGFSMTKEYQFFFSAAFGLSVSVFAALRSLIIVELLGLEKLTNAFGLVLLFQGVGATVGAPLAGALKDMTGSYDASFYFAGILIVISAVICYPLNRLNLSEKEKESDQEAFKPAKS